ncbi:MAG TPA: hypothetical protein VGG62_16505 [Terracidiphilus sp.]
MKLRIKGNSLRLRVSPSEMKQLLQSGRVEETISFGADEDARLTYALEQSAQAGAMTVVYRPQEVTVVVSSREARDWAEGNGVGLYGSTGSGHGLLELAIEKDFACLDKSGAENADTFPNPNQGAVC